MITNPQVFGENHLPRTLEHRAAEVRQLTRALKPVVDGNRAEDVLISGPSGVGKTVLSRFGINRLQERTAVGNARVRCLGKTTGTILREAIKNLPIGASCHRGMQVPELVEILREGVEDPAVLVLDEGDDIPEHDLLEVLSGVPLLSVVVICHDPDHWLAQIGDRGIHFEGDSHIQLSRYGVGELADILSKRSKRGLRRGAVERDILEEIADEAAGVARRGIQGLRCSAEIAEEEEASQVTKRHIGPGFERARSYIRESNLRSLPLHHHVVYELVRSYGPLSGQELHEWYDRVGSVAYGGTPKTPVSRGYRRTILRKLEEYDLVDSEKTAGSGRYWVVEPELVSELDISVVPAA